MVCDMQLFWYSVVQLPLILSDIVFVQGDEVDDRADPLPEQPNDIPDNLDLPDDLTVDDADGDQDRESKGMQHRSFLPVCCNCHGWPYC